MTHAARLAVSVASVGVVLIALSIAAVTLIPNEIIGYINEVPIKVAIIIVSVVLVTVGAIFAYWILYMPSKQKVTLGLMRCGLLAILGNMSVPPAIFGLEKLSIVLNRENYVQVSMAQATWASVAMAVVACVFTFLLFREYKDPE